MYGTVVSRLGIYSGSDDVRGTRISYMCGVTVTCESVHLFTILFVFSVRVPGARRRGGAGASVYVWTLADRDAQGRHFTVYGIRAGTPRWLAASPSRVSRRRRYKLYRGICVQVHMFMYDV